MGGFQESICFGIADEVSGLLIEANFSLQTIGDVAEKARGGGKIRLVDFRGEQVALPDETSLQSQP